MDGIAALSGRATKTSGRTNWQFRLKGSFPALLIEAAQAWAPSPRECPLPTVSDRVEDLPHRPATRALDAGEQLPPSRPAAAPVVAHAGTRSAMPRWCSDMCASFSMRSQVTFRNQDGTPALAAAAPPGRGSAAQCRRIASGVVAPFTQAAEHRLLAALVKHPCVSLGGGTAGVRLRVR
jgi:hypothetical protein